MLAAANSEKFIVKYMVLLCCRCLSAGVLGEGADPFRRPEAVVTISRTELPADMRGCPVPGGRLTCPTAKGATTAVTPGQSIGWRKRYRGPNGGLPWIAFVSFIFPSASARTSHSLCRRILYLERSSISRPGNEFRKNLVTGW